MFGGGAGIGGWVCCSLVVAPALALALELGYERKNSRGRGKLRVREALVCSVRGERKKRAKMRIHITVHIILF